MTGRERIMTAFELREADRAPVWIQRMPSRATATSYVPQIRSIRA